MSDNPVIREAIIKVNRFSLLSFLAFYISYLLWIPQAESFHLDLCSWMFAWIGTVGVFNTLKLIIQVYRYERNEYKIASKGQETRPNTMIRESDFRKKGLFK